MGNIRMIGAFFCMAMFFLGSCASPARFSQDEIKSYPLDIQEKIIKGEVTPGMTPQQVRYAWGSPQSVRTLEPENGRTREEWVYSTIGILKTRLTFIDGKLAYIISSEPGRIK